jgi:MtN3 and saliva related transmembrane protein
MNSLLVDTIGMTGTVLTTVCWPQATKIIRSRETRAISLTGTLAFTIGIVFWLIYGLALMDWPLITSNVVTLAHVGDRGAEAEARVSAVAPLCDPPHIARQQPRLSSPRYTSGGA